MCASIFRVGYLFSHTMSNWARLQKALPKVAKPTARRPAAKKKDAAVSEVSLPPTDPLFQALLHQTIPIARLSQMYTATKRPTARQQQPGRYVAMDCEFVGVGKDGLESALARVLVVNWFGVVLLDTFVRPDRFVTDFRTAVSGVRARDLNGAALFADAQEKVRSLLQDRILVGHAVHNDLEKLGLTHPRKQIQDTQTYAPYRSLAKGKKPSLKRLAELVLGAKIQLGSHSSVEDARATMLLFRLDGGEKYGQMS